MPFVAHLRLAAALLAAAGLLSACVPGPASSFPPNPGGPPGIVLPPNPGTPNPGPGRQPRPDGDDPVTSPGPGRDDPPRRPPVPDPGPPPATGTWRLAEIDGARAGFAATLRLLPSGEVRGEGPCNSFSARAQGRPPALRIVGLRATERACPDLAAEIRFFDALAAVERMAQQGNRLTLTGAGGRRLVFLR